MLVAGLPERFEAIAACGSPTPSFTGTSTRATCAVAGTSGARRPAPDPRPNLLDWGDAASATRCWTSRRSWTVSRRRAGDAATMGGRWRRHLPARTGGGGTAGRAGAAARQALIYQEFLDHIEPVERHDHDADVPQWLRGRRRWRPERAGPARDDGARRSNGGRRGASLSAVPRRSSALHAASPG